MKSEVQGSLSTLFFILALLVFPLSSHANLIIITYSIGSTASDPVTGFSGSWLHAGSSQMGSSGYFANGHKARVSGTLALHMPDGSGAASASGQLTGSGNFDVDGDDHDWTLDITGASAGNETFVGGETDLLSLNYDLTSAGGEHALSGTFYFADRDFNGGIRSNGPNYITSNVLYLWGNNWVNTSGGSADRTAFVKNNNALGLDLYGEATSVPEPGTLALLAVGLLGLGFRSRIKSA